MLIVVVQVVVQTRDKQLAPLQDLAPCTLRESRDRSPDPKSAGELVEPEREEFRCALARSNSQSL